MEDWKPEDFLEITIHPEDFTFDDEEYEPQWVIKPETKPPTYIPSKKEDEQHNPYRRLTIEEYKKRTKCRPPSPILQKKKKKRAGKKVQLKKQISILSRIRATTLKGSEEHEKARKELWKLKKMGLWSSKEEVVVNENVGGNIQTNNAGNQHFNIDYLILIIIVIFIMFKIHKYYKSYVNKKLRASTLAQV